MSPDQKSQSAFDFRLGGGVSFAFGPPRPGDGGIAQILHAPDFCNAPELARYFDPGAKAQWDFAPIDSTARRRFATEVSLERVSDIDVVTHGVGFIYFSGGYQCVFVELCLPTNNTGSSGLSTFDDWLRIVQAAKDDQNREALLRLNFAPHQLQVADVAAFKTGNRFATTDIELHVRLRAFQWSRDN